MARVSTSLKTPAVFLTENMTPYFSTIRQIQPGVKASTLRSEGERITNQPRQDLNRKSARKRATFSIFPYCWAL